MDDVGRFLIWDVAILCIGGAETWNDTTWSSSSSSSSSFTFASKERHRLRAEVGREVHQMLKGKGMSR